MYRVSSNLTVFFKLFLPTVWTVFFSAFTASLFLASEDQLPFLTSPSFKYPFLAVFILLFLVLYFTLIQLKRVEMGADFYVVTNYFKSYRLIYEDIEKVSVTPFFGLRIIVFRLRAKGSFGNKIVFLSSKFLYESFLESHPEIAGRLNPITNI